MTIYVFIKNRTATISLSQPSSHHSLKIFKQYYILQLFIPHYLEVYCEVTWWTKGGMREGCDLDKNMLTSLMSPPSLPQDGRGAGLEWGVDGSKADSPLSCPA